ncbi:hypothetical protein N0V90_012405 [Kalmusia sp. IMI 367209]|nr:hypothetical protein N0V90_012405 [Kalmusia sp. IMI 367209]
MALEKESASLTLHATNFEEVRKSAQAQELETVQASENTQLSSKVKEHRNSPEEIQGQGSAQPRTDEKVVPLFNHPLQIEPQESAGIKDIIIFIDPLGTRWELPFDAAKTWKGFKSLVSGIFDAALTGIWLSGRLDDSNGYEDGRIFVSKYPDRMGIKPTEWDQVVKPGWQVEIWFAGEPDIVTRALKASQIAVPDPENSKSVPEIGYIGRLFQQDGMAYPDLIREKIYKEPLVNKGQRLTRQCASVISEMRNVFLSLDKRGKNKHKDYDTIHIDDIIGTCTLQIESDHLFNALKALLSFCSPADLDKDEGFDLYRHKIKPRSFRHFVFPFKDLYWHIQELESYSSNMKGPRSNHSNEYNATCDRHIEVLLQYLQQQSTINFPHVRKNWSKSIPTTNFKTLWILFKPGSEVYVRERGQLNAYIIERVEGISRSYEDQPQPYKIVMWNIDFDGERLGRSVKEIQIPVFDDDREIASLPVFPVRFYQDNSEGKPLQEKLIERGKTFVQAVTRPTYRDFTGTNFIDIAGLKEPKNDPKVIETLVMKPTSNKDIVKAICEMYTQEDDNELLFFADNIRGKGEGQIILLHGPPGTGKTLTAGMYDKDSLPWLLITPSESVAEFIGRPLLSITGADLGHEPVHLEKNLLKFFRNASKWDAIVLLDEADVYLERRSIDDLQRNSIVTGKYYCL